MGEKVKTWKFRHCKLKALTTINWKDATNEKRIDDSTTVPRRGIATDMHTIDTRFRETMWEARSRPYCDFST